MEDRFTRRGFTKATIAGAVAVWLPSVASADPFPVIHGRIEVSVRDSQLSVDLYISHEGTHGLELRRGALGLRGAARVGGERHPLRLQSFEQMFARRSRAGIRRVHRVLVPAEQEVIYGRFSGPSTQLANGARVHLRTVLEVDPNAYGPAERAGLKAIAGLRLSGRVERS